MGNTSTMPPTDLHTTAPRSLRREAAVGTVAATAANVAVWAVGRAADASFLVVPLGAEETMNVNLAAIVPTTLVMYAAGIGLFALAAQRSERWARGVLAAGVLLAVVSASGPLSAAEDTTTGVALAAMHLLTGAAFAVTVRRARRPDGA